MRNLKRSLKVNFNPFKCRHKRTYEVTTKLVDGSLVVNHYCRKCEECVRVDIDSGFPRPSAVRPIPPRPEIPEVEKLRHQGMLLEKVPEKYITVEIDKKYLDKGTYMFDGKGNLVKIGMHE